MSRKLFTDEDARDFFAKKAGQSYRPSNGTEGGIFYDVWCCHCVKDDNDDCPILAASFWADLGSPDYPKEWIWGEDGQPKCTAFEQRK